MTNTDQQQRDSARICELAGFIDNELLEGEDWELAEGKLSRWKRPGGGFLEEINLFAQRGDVDYDERSLDVLNLAAMALEGRTVARSKYEQELWRLAVPGMQEESRNSKTIGGAMADLSARDRAAAIIAALDAEEATDANED